MRIIATLSKKAGVEELFTFQQTVLGFSLAENVFRGPL